jgi:hypothetical protein
MIYRIAGPLRHTNLLRQTLRATISAATILQYRSLTRCGISCPYQKPQQQRGESIDNVDTESSRSRAFGRAIRSTSRADQVVFYSTRQTTLGWNGVFGSTHQTDEGPIGAGLLAAGPLAVFFFFLAMSPNHPSTAEHSITPAWGKHCTWAVGRCGHLARHYPRCVGEGTGVSTRTAAPQGSVYGLL